MALYKHEIPFLHFQAPLQQVPEKKHPPRAGPPSQWPNRSAEKGRTPQLASAVTTPTKRKLFFFLKLETYPQLIWETSTWVEIVFSWWYVVDRGYHPFFCPTWILQVSLLAMKARWPVFANRSWLAEKPVTVIQDKAFHQPEHLRKSTRIAMTTTVRKISEV